MMLSYVILFLMISNTLCDIKDGGQAPRITLNDGNTMPVIGLGTFLGFDENGQKPVKDREVELPVIWALNAGYRMIDTAALYHNEQQVGLGVRNANVSRKDVFIVTKLASNEQRTVIEGLKKSLARLNMSYVDLYLIHNPISFTPDESKYDTVDYVDTWRAMEEAQRLGLAKSIGISNFNISQMERLIANCEIKPAVLQVEVNLNLAQHQLLDYTQTNNITVMAYTPFGSLFKDNAPPPRVNDAMLVGLGKKYQKSVPQIILRYLVQRGVIPIPKSVNKDRIEQNIDIFDFELSSDDMEALAKFNKDYRTVWPSFWQDHIYYPFEKKDVPDPDLFKKKN